MSSIELLKTSRKRKSLKLNRVKAHQRLFVDQEPISLDPDSILINKIIKNIKQEMRGKNHD